MTDHLEAALAALGEGDRVAALDALLAAWTQSRTPRLADVIDVVSLDVNRGLPPIDPAGGDFHQRWSEVALRKRAVDVERLLPGLMAEPLGTLSARVALLAERAPDPRLTRVFGQMIAAPPTTSTSNFATWTNLFKAVPVNGDVRLLPFLRSTKGAQAGGATFAAKFTALVQKAIEQLTEPAPVSAADAARVEAVEGKARALAKGAPQKVTEPAPSAPARASDDPLAQALAALREGNGERALDLLLEAWSRKRLPALAEPIEALSTELARTRVAIAGGKALHDQWQGVEREGKAADVPRLLQAAMTPPINEAEVRLARLAVRPPDPRIGRFFEAERSDWRVGARAAFWRALFDGLLQHGDGLLLPQLDERWGHDARQVTNVDVTTMREARRVLPLMHQRFDGAKPTLDAKETRDLAGVTEAIAALQSKQKAARGAGDATELGLLDAIVADWDSDAPRLVYADFLAERGGHDALRAELIMLQSTRARGARDAAKVAREKELLKDLVPLLGPLARVVPKGSVKFERGLLVAASADRQKLQMHRQQVVGHPLWTTVRDLTIERDCGELLLHPVMKSVRFLRGDFPAILAFVEASPRPTLEALTYFQEDGPTDAFLDGKSLPGVRSLKRISSELPPPRVAGSQLYALLESLEVGYTGHNSLIEWLKLSEARKWGLRELHFHGNAFDYTLARGKDGELSELTVAPGRGKNNPALEQELASLSKRLTRLRAKGQINPEARGMLRAAAQSAGLELS